jgi:hypothetical protein
LIGEVHIVMVTGNENSPRPCSIPVVIALPRALGAREGSSFRTMHTESRKCC